jgi:hypothetical protein
MGAISHEVRCDNPNCRKRFEVITELNPAGHSKTPLDGNPQPPPARPPKKAGCISLLDWVDGICSRRGAVQKPDAHK